LVGFFSNSKHNTQKHQHIKYHIKVPSSKFLFHTQASSHKFPQATKHKTKKRIMPSSPATTQQDSLDVFTTTPSYTGGKTSPLSKLFSMCRGGGSRGADSESEDYDYEGGMNYWCMPTTTATTSGNSKTTTKAKTLPSTGTSHDDDNDEEETTATGTTSTDRSGSSVGFWDTGVPSSIFSTTTTSATTKKTSAVSFSPPPTPSRVDRSDCGGGDDEEEEDGSSSSETRNVDAGDGTAAAEKTSSSSSSSIDVGFAIQVAACVAAVVMFPPSV